MKSLFFIRHGQSQANLEHITAGQLDTPLTQVGISQAEHAAEQLAKSDIKIDVIVSSPLSRSKITAQIIATKLNYPPDRIKSVDDLRERSCGGLEGKPTEFYYNLPEDESVRDYNVESLERLYARAERVLAWLEKTYPDQTVLLISHSGFGKMLKIVTNKLTISAYDKTDNLANAQLLRLL